MGFLKMVKRFAGKNKPFKYAASLDKSKMSVPALRLMNLSPFIDDNNKMKSCIETSRQWRPGPASDSMPFD